MKKRKAGCAALALMLALNCGCVRAASASRQETRQTDGTSAAQSAPADEALDEAALAEALRLHCVPDESRLAAFEVRSAGVVPPEGWDEYPLLDEHLVEQERTWRGWLEADEVRRLFAAVFRVEYTPEATINGPQYAGGIWTVLALLEPAGEGYDIVASSVADIGPDDVPASFEAAELAVTDDQWAILQHQLAALAAGGVWRDYTSPADWTAEEFTCWLALRAQSWPGTDGQALSQADVLRMVQADFSPENGVWNSADVRLQESGLLDNGLVALPAAEDPARFFEEQVSVEYSRQLTKDQAAEGNAPMRPVDEVVATVTIPTTEGEVRMEYRFGLVPPDNGPVSRTWLMEARRLTE